MTYAPLGSREDRKKILAVVGVGSVVAVGVGSGVGDGRSTAGDGVGVGLGVGEDSPPLQAARARRTGTARMSSHFGDRAGLE